MKPGPKAKTPTETAATGMLWPFRDAGKVELLVPGDPPIMPDYITPEAICVWQEVVGRVMSAGVREIDSALLAR